MNEAINNVALPVDECLVKSLVAQMRVWTIFLDTDILLRLVTRFFILYLTFQYACFLFKMEQGKYAQAEQDALQALSLLSSFGFVLPSTLIDAYLALVRVFLKLASVEVDETRRSTVCNEREKETVNRFINVK